MVISGSVRFVAGFQIERLATRSARELPVVWFVRVFLNLSGTAGPSQNLTDFSGPLQKLSHRLEFE